MNTRSGDRVLKIETLRDSGSGVCVNRHGGWIIDRKWNRFEALRLIKEPKRLRERDGERAAGPMKTVIVLVINQTHSKAKGEEGRKKGSAQPRSLDR